MNACPASTSGRCTSSVSRVARQPFAARKAPRAVRARPIAALKPEDTPDWVRELEEHAKIDESVARLLQGTGGDPKIIQERMRAEMDALHERIQRQTSAGSERPMEVSFRAVDTFSLWVWLQFCTPPAPQDLEMLQEVIDSWFLVGRMGGFNSSNLQIMYANDAELAGLEYDPEEGRGLPATMHDMAPLEGPRGAWARFWVDMGTADELALDVLVNVLSTFSKEQLGIKQVVFGGENDDWPTGDPRLAGLPEVTMDPMRGPVALDDEDDDQD